MIYRKYYMDKIKPFIGKPVIKLITGMRRVGKSTILKMVIDLLKSENISENNIIYINKESLKYEFINDYKDLYNYVSDKFKEICGKKYIFIDEIQEIIQWEKAISSIFSEDLGEIFITGSNAHMLSSDIATLLSGRYIEIKIYPLVFSEFLKFREFFGNVGNLDDEFNLFIKFGGFPGIHYLEFNDEVVFQFLGDIFNSILLKDVVTRYNIRDINLLERISRFVYDNCGNITTSKKISDFLKSQKVNISVNTVKNYISYLKNAFLLFEVNRFDIKGKKFLELYEKYYMGDIGLRHGFIGYRNDDISGILENVVYLELLRRGYNVRIGKRDDKEIDFIGIKADETVYYQVTYLLADESAIKREFGVFDKVDDNYSKYVLSMDKLFAPDIKGIKWKNILDFLLEE